MNTISSMPGDQPENNEPTDVSVDAAQPTQPPSTEKVDDFIQTIRKMYPLTPKSSATGFGDMQ